MPVFEIQYPRYPVDCAYTTVRRQLADTLMLLATGPLYMLEYGVMTSNKQGC
jgi:hypothetical protein